MFLGERLIGAILTVCDAAEVNPLLMMLRSLATDEDTVQMMRQFLHHNVLRPVGAALGVPDGELRAALAATQVAGLLMMRYVLQLESVASVPAETLTRIVGRNIQRYFTSDLDAPPP